jgi:pyridoxamine 5'-phosphate oxidase
MKLNIADIRRDYKKKKLNVRVVNKDPFVQFEQWLNEALEIEDDPTAMILGTAGLDGRPSTRAVLLKGLEEGKLVFYTNYQSSKALQIKENPHVSVTFFWPKLERQVHFEGTIQRTPADVSDDYFYTRPRKSRIGARISPQSQVIGNRNELKTAFVKEASRFIGKKVPRPEHWGGYYIFPDLVEFWQGRASRLHDRIRYLKSGDQDWKIERLAP